MTEKRYHVVYTGRLVPGTDRETARSNLILDTGLSDEKAAQLLKKNRMLLKRFPTVPEAQRMAEDFERAGLICVIEDHASGPDAASAQANGESSLITIMHKFIPSSRKDRPASRRR